MTLDISIHSWEHPLIAWAQEPLKALQHHHHHHHARLTLNDPQRVLAYQHCHALTRHHSKTFFMASALLPKAKRDAVRALYAFCRVTDDLVDENVSGNDPLEALGEWQRLTSQAHPPADNLVAFAWADAQCHFHIPKGYAEQLIQGVAKDAEHNRYSSFNDLAGYAYGVASTVGLMAMHIIGYSHPDAVSYAVKLGVALQLTNILRDVGEDWRKGRVYLPQEELAHYGLSDADIAAGVVDDRWRAFMRFQIERNRQIYRESLHGIQLLQRDGRFAINAAAGLYQGILDDIERHDYDVFSRRAHLSTWGKISRLPSLWWNATTA